MNPIYKTGWGQYVDLSKIVSIQRTEIGCCWIHFQMTESPIEISRPVNCSYAAWSIAVGGVTTEDVTKEAQKIQKEMQDREPQIDALIMAWESYRNQ